MRWTSVTTQSVRVSCVKHCRFLSCIRGYIIHVHSDNLARGQRKLGRVEVLLTGPDGHHREAVLRAYSFMIY